MINELEIQEFLRYLKNNGNLQRLTTNSDNKKAPVHRWFPFLAGFSHLFVKETFRYFNMDEKDLVFDPFMGSGTTALVGKEIGVSVVGNEINPFLYKICKAKIASHKLSDSTVLMKTGKKMLLKIASEKWKNADISNEHPLLKKCYPVNNLKKLVTLRNLIIDGNIMEKHKQYFSIILTRCLLHSAQVGINVPYVSWSSQKKPQEVFTLFEENLRMICEDLKSISRVTKNYVKTKVFLHDSRLRNKEIKTKSVSMIFTSPPYLNNFDYGESLKVFLYFWKIANNWREITEKIRKVGVTSATTYYRECELLSKPYEEILGEDLLNKIPNVSQEIIQKAYLVKKRIIQKEKITKRRKKSFDLLTLLYFKDMFFVLQEMYRVLKKGSLCFIIIGDSAPYGVHIPSDTILGEMGVEMGFSSYTLQPLRERGIKWKTLTYRHNKRLRESLLILRR